jgi:hypothetical protein
MTNRPCKPDADLKWLWRTLLPGMPLPACGTPENSDAAGDKSVKIVTDLQDDAEAHAKRRATSAVRRHLP